MLTIKHIALNQYFEIDNVKIPLHLFNPFFTKNGSLSFSSTMTAHSDINQLLCNYPNQPGRKDNTGFSIPVEIGLLGATKRCIMNIISANEKDIKWNLNFDEGAFNSTHGEKNIQDFEYGGEQVLPYTNEFLSFVLPDWDHEYYTKSYPEVNCQFPLIYNPDFFNGSSYEEVFKVVANAVNIPQNRFIWSDVVHGNIDTRVHAITPCPFLAFILDSICKELGYSLSKSFLHSEEFQNLLLLPTRDIVKIFVTLEGLSTNVSFDNSRYSLKDFVPKITIKDLIKQLENKFNTHFFIDDNNATIRIVNFDEALKEPPVEDLSDFFTKPVLKKVTRYISYAFIDDGVHTADYDAVTIDLREFASKILPDTYTIETLDGKAFRVGDVVRMYDLPYNAYIYKQLQEKEYEDGEKYYAWVFVGIEGIGFSYSSLSETEKELVFKSKVTFLPYSTTGISIRVVDNDDLEVRPVNLPMEGFSEYKNSENYEGNLIMAFYNKFGEQISGNDCPNPTAGSINRISGTSNTLYYEGEGGIIEKCWKNTLEHKMKRGREFESLPSLPIEKLFTLDTSKKYLIHGGTYMIHTIKAQLEDNAVKYEKSILVEC